jgi:ABC-type nitrate/sulfonate/bicarbonate transport system permease component
MAPKVALVSAAVGYIVLSTTLDGVRHVDGELVTAVQVMGARRLQVVRIVILPSALSAILLGLRLAIPYGLVATIAADMLVGAQGLGFLISRASGYLDIDQLFAAIAIVLAIGVALSTLIGGRQQTLASRSW